MINDKKIINAWAFYDWANSAFPLVITAAIFPPFYEKVTLAANGSEFVNFLGFYLKNSVLYSYAFSFSFLVTAFLSPLLSGIADFLGTKKSFMRFFVLLGSLSCMVLFFFNGNNLWLGILAIITGNIGFNASLVFYNAYLPEIASNDKIDKVSAKGFSLGYLGGFILLVLNLVFIIYAPYFGIIDINLPYQISFLSVGIWWLGFSQYSFIWLPKKKQPLIIRKHYILNGFKELNITYKQIRELKTIRLYLLSFFIYSMGVQTVLYMASMFGSKVLHVDTPNLIGSILLIQIIAIVGSQFFAYLSKKIGNFRAISVALFIWVIICLIAYNIFTTNGFYLLAALVGLVMGGIQSLSRSTYSKLLPSELKDTASFFSFYEFCEKIAIVLGIASYGLIEQLSGNMRNSVTILGLYFIFGFITILYAGKGKLKAV